MTSSRIPRLSVSLAGTTLRPACVGRPPDTHYYLVAFYHGRSSLSVRCCSQLRSELHTVPRAVDSYRIRNSSAVRRSKAIRVLEWRENLAMRPETAGVSAASPPMGRQNSEAHRDLMGQAARSSYGAGVHMHSCPDVRFELQVAAGEISKVPAPCAWDAPRASCGRLIFRGSGRNSCRGRHRRLRHRNRVSPEAGPHSP